MLNEDHKKVLTDARTAVRAYAKDRSEKNAERVESAWQAVKRMRAASAWRQPSNQLDSALPE